MLQLLAVSSLLLALFWFYRSRRRRFSLFERLGIPGPRPSLISGNLTEIMEKGAVTLFDEWIRQYGDVVGFYNGASPMLMIKNLDLIKEIQVQDFSNFYDRGMTSIILRTHKITKMNLQHASGDHWKNMRKVITRQFTPSRLKKQATLMDQCCSEFMEVLESLHPQDEAIEVHSVFQKLSLDVMLLSLFGGEGRTAIGREEAGPEIIKRELKKFMASLGSGWQRFIIDCFPEFSLLMRGLLFLRGYFMKYAVDRIQDEMSKMISQRLSSSTVPNSYASPCNTPVTHKF